ncbi:hypothetical protein Hanom_Chr09g00870431 [Helianthus anomalus]
MIILAQLLFSYSGLKAMNLLATRSLNGTCSLQQMFRGKQQSYIIYLDTLMWLQFTGLMAIWLKLISSLDFVLKMKIHLSTL